MRRQIIKKICLQVFGKEERERERERERKGSEGMHSEKNATLFKLVSLQLQMDEKG